MSYLKINKHKYWDSMADTGFGDRIKTWSYAYEINKLNNFSFTILVDDFEWRETQYLNFRLQNLSRYKQKKLRLKIYFSFICNTPINEKKPRAITGDQTDKIKGILSV